MKRVNKTNIIKACTLSFRGTMDKDIMKILNIASSTLSRWRQLPLWKQVEESLIEKAIEKEFNQDLPTEDVES